MPTHNHAVTPLNAFRRALSRLGRGWGIALRFLTVAPWGRWQPGDEAHLGCAAALFPWVGAFVGGAVVATRWGALRLHSSPAVAAALTLTAWVLLTGGLHLDGLMDAADGLLGGQTPAQRLEIMHDERVGAFGVLAAALVLLLKYSALQSTSTAAVILAPVVGRWVLVAAMGLFPYAREQGLGGVWHAQITRRSLLAATLATLAGLVAAGSLALWAAAALSVAAAAGLALAAQRRIPGLTGDVYGALAEISEALFLLGSLWWHAL